MRNFKSSLKCPKNCSAQVVFLLARCCAQVIQKHRVPCVILPCSVQVFIRRHQSNNCQRFVRNSLVFHLLIRWRFFIIFLFMCIELCKHVLFLYLNTTDVLESSFIELLLPNPVSSREVCGLGSCVV